MKPQQFLFGQAGLQLAATGRKLRENRALYAAAQFAGHTAMGLLAAMAVLFGHLAPFGVAVAAAAGSGTLGLFTLLGATAGYILMWGAVESLKYVAILVLTFAGLYVFRGVAFARKPLFMPLVTLSSGAFVGIVFVAELGFPASDTVLFVTELILMTGGAYVFRVALQPDAPADFLPRRVGVLLLTAVALLALTPLTLLGVALPARAAAVAVVLWYASRGATLAASAGSGAVSGLTLGVAMDMALGTPFFSVSYGAAGLMAGIFTALGRMWSVAAFIVTGAIAALWTDDPALRIASLAETFVGTVCFVLLPAAHRDRTPRRAARAVYAPPSHEQQVRQYIRRRLSAGSQAFTELHDSLAKAFEGFAAPRNDDDVSGVFDRASNKVCRKCALTGVCWDREVTGTYNALNDASRHMLELGAVAPADFPVYFSSRCLQFPRFVKAVNDELGSLAYRRQYRARLRESRKQVCEQYAEMSKLLRDAADELGGELSFDENAERLLQERLRPWADNLTVSVYRVSGGRCRVDIDGADLSPLLGDPGGVGEVLSEALGLPMGEPEQQHGTLGDRITYCEREALRPSIGVAAYKKQGQTVSGDSGTYFKTADGKLYILLSDGMGSGAAANAESALAVRLLERFLRAGIAPETALTTLNSALILRGEDNLGFVTVDLLIADLLSGESRLYKYGAAPSYLRRGAKVARIRCRELPAGLGLNGEPKIDVTRFTLRDGDTLVLCSDGVSDVTDDGWVSRQLLSGAADAPKAQAERLLAGAANQNGRGDDMTVLVLTISLAS